MRIEEVLELPSMPLAGPSYPKGPYRFIDREYMIISYETDPEIIREQLPEPLQPLDTPLVHYEFIKMPDSSGFGSYTESGLVIPCRYQGEEMNFVAQMYLDDDPPIVAGREIWGFPEEIRPPQARDRQGHAHRHARIFRPAGGHGHHGLQAREHGRQRRQDNRDARQDAGQSQADPRRRRPCRQLCQLVCYNLTEIVVKGSWIGPGRLHLVPHVNAPVADLPVRRVVGAHHFIVDLTLPYGRVLYDYLESR